MSSFGGAVAELFASLGLDASQFKEGLVQATADFETFAASVGSATAQYEANIAQIAALMGASVDEALSLVDALRQSMVVTNEATGLLENSVSFEGAAILALQQLKVADAELDAKIAAANKEFAAQKKADALEYAAVAKEASASVRAQMEEDVATQSIVDKLWTALVKDDANARAAAEIAANKEVTASAVESSEVQVASAFATRQAYGGIFSNAAVEARVLTQEVGGLTGGMGTLLSRVPIVGEALNAVFPIIVAGVFIDVLVHVGEKINELVVDWEGFDKASTKAWDSAREGAIKAQSALVEYQNHLRDADSKGLKGSALDIAKFGNSQEDKDALLAQTHLLEQARDNNKAIADLGKQAEGQQLFGEGLGAVAQEKRDEAKRRLQGQLGFEGANQAIADAAAAVKEYQAQIDKNYKEIANLNIQMARDEADLTRKLEEENDKREKEEQKAADAILRIKREMYAEEIRLANTATSGPGSIEQLLTKGAVPSEATGLSEITRQLQDVNKEQQDQIYLMQKSKETALTDPWGVQVLTDGKFAVDDFRISQQSLAKELQNTHAQMALTNRVIFQASTTFINDLASLASGRETVHAFFLTLIDDIEKTILKLTILEPITAWLKSELTGTSSGGGFLGALGSLFGIGSGSTAASAPSFATFDSGLISPQNFLAAGGDVAPGGVYRVGENGPETFVPSTPGTIIPNGASFGGGTSVIITNNNDFRGVSPDQQAQLEARLTEIHARSVQDAAAMMDEREFRRA